MPKLAADQNLEEKQAKTQNFEQHSSIKPSKDLEEIRKAMIVGKAETHVKPVSAIKTDKQKLQADRHATEQVKVRKFGSLAALKPASDSQMLMIGTRSKPQK